MKVFSIILLLYISISSVFSQEFIKNSTVNFKDKTVLKGDFYYYQSDPKIVIIADSTGKKQDYPLSKIDFVEGSTSIYKNLNYNGESKLFDCIIEGEKLSLYKTNENDDLQLFVLKGNQIYWLEGGQKEMTNDSKKYIKEIVAYKGILKVLIRDNADLSKKIDNITYSEREISDIIIAYNEGHITNFKNKEVDHLNKIPNWKIYSNYSKYSGTPLFTGNDLFESAGSFFQIGGEYFASEGSRHSLKLGVEYGKFNNKNSNLIHYDGDNIYYYETWAKYLNLNFSYYYDFYRIPKANFYIAIRLIDMGQLWNSTKNDFILAPRISPGFGYEFHLTNTMDLFGEINHILIIHNLAGNFSVGITYDI